MFNSPPQKFPLFRCENFVLYLKLCCQCSVLLLHFYQIYYYSHSLKKLIRTWYSYSRHEWYRPTRSPPVGLLQQPSPTSDIRLIHQATDRQFVNAIFGSWRPEETVMTRCIERQTTVFLRFLFTCLSVLENDRKLEKSIAILARWTDSYIACRFRDKMTNCNICWKKQQAQLSQETQLHIVSAT